MPHCDPRKSGSNDNNSFHYLPPEFCLLWIIPFKIIYTVYGLSHHPPRQRRFFSAPADDRAYGKVSDGAEAHLAHRSLVTVQRQPRECRAVKHLHHQYVDQVHAHRRLSEPMDQLFCPVWKLLQCFLVAPSPYQRRRRHKQDANASDAADKVFVQSIITCADIQRQSGGKRQS